MTSQYIIISFNTVYAIMFSKNIIFKYLGMSDQTRVALLNTISRKLIFVLYFLESIIHTSIIVGFF